MWFKIFLFLALKLVPKWNCIRCIY